MAAIKVMKSVHCNISFRCSRTTTKVAVVGYLNKCSLCAFFRTGGTLLYRKVPIPICVPIFWRVCRVEMGKDFSYRNAFF